jgi:hypothetical protein
MEKKSSTLTGITGEYYVAAELSKRGLYAAITLRNNEGYDILVTNPRTKRQFGVQVKTTRNRRKWVLTKKTEGETDENLYYVFVNLLEECVRPEFFVINSVKLATIVKSEYEKWITTAGHKGQSRNDNSIRGFCDKKGDYKEKWDVFEKPV